MEEHIKYGEQDVCAKCGSENVKITGIQKDVNILIWYICNECGAEFIDCFEFTAKGVPSE